MNATVPELVTRRPTGKPPWPMLLIAGVEKAGKSYSGALFSASDLVDRTFWIEIGEGAADQYGAIPGARYEIVQHDGTYTGIGRAIWAATQQPRTNGRPNAIVIDSITELWDLVAEEQQGTANRRAIAKAESAGKKAPVGEAQITMDLWNAAKKRWRRIIDTLRTYDGPVIVLARLELVTVMDDKGKPSASGAKEWKIRAEKNLPFECDAIVKMTAPQQAALTGVRSTVLSTPPGEELPLPAFTIDGLLRSLGLDAEGATSPRAYTAPRAETVDVEPQERPAQRRDVSQGPADDEWTTPPQEAPSAVNHTPNEPGITRPQMSMMQATFNEKGIKSREDKLAFAIRIAGRPLQTANDLTKAEASRVIDALNTGEIPPATAKDIRPPLADGFAEDIRNAPTSDVLANVSEEAWAALEAGSITSEQHKVLMDQSMARESELSGQAREAVTV